MTGYGRGLCTDFPQSVACERPRLPVNSPKGRPMPTLFLRADDAALSPGTNAAIDAATRNCPNLGLMATGPALADAAERFRGRNDVCLGLHFTLNSEWDHLRWGAVSPVNTVPHLLQKDGTFYPNPWRLPEGHSYPIVEVERELRAQLAQLRSLGLDIRYLDSHMAVFKTRPDLEELALRFAADEGLAYPDRIEGIAHGPYGPDLATDLTRWDQTLRDLDDRPRLAVFHPAQADGVMETLRIDGPVLPTRAAEAALLASEEFTRLLQAQGVQIARIDSLN